LSQAHLQPQVPQPHADLTCENERVLRPLHASLILQRCRLIDKPRFRYNSRSKGQLMQYSDKYPLRWWDASPKPWANAWVEPWVNAWAEPWVKAWAEPWVDAWVEAWANAWAEPWANTWVEPWTDTWADTWANSWAESSPNSSASSSLSSWADSWVNSSPMSYASYCSRPCPEAATAPVSLLFPFFFPILTAGTGYCIIVQ
jgi:hypothetical protein